MQDAITRYDPSADATPSATLSSAGDLASDSARCFDSAIAISCLEMSEEWRGSRVRLYDLHFATGGLPGVMIMIGAALLLLADLYAANRRSG